MALTGSQKAYLQARSGIARSAAIRSNYVFPLYGVITVNGADITKVVMYGTLKITMGLNEQPDTASFDVYHSDPSIEPILVVGANVVIGLGGATANPLFGGRILTIQTTRGPARTHSVRSVMCADYLQVLDSEYLVTYDWQPQSATTTINDLIGRFTNKPGGAGLSAAGVGLALPSHAAFGVANERFSTVLRRLVTMFPGGGGFYVDPLSSLHVWEGVSEPNLTNPTPLTIDSPMLKAFADTIDNSQQRDGVIVEGVRTSAPLGLPGPDVAYDPTGRNIQSIPVIDARIINPDPPSGVGQEVRIGTQRLTFLRAEGIWTSPAGTPQATVATADVAFNPNPTVENNTVTIPLESVAMFAARVLPWIKIDEQYLKVLSFGPTGPGPYVQVPRTGFGAMIAEININAVVTVVDSLGQGTVTGRYDWTGNLEKIRPQAIDSDVVMTVRQINAYGIHEHLVQDGRYTRPGALARANREVEDFKYPLTSIQFETVDLNAFPGRLQSYTLTDPPLTAATGQYMILTAELTWPVWGQPPRRTCYAAAVHPADVTDSWLVDKG